LCRGADKSMIPTSRNNPLSQFQAISNNLDSVHLVHNLQEIDHYMYMSS
jgi:hypothetical protein